MNEMSSWISIGRIGRAKGLRGEVRVQVYNPQSHLLDEVRSVAAGPDVDHVRTLSIAEISQQPKAMIVSFEGVSTREEAEALTGHEIYVRRSDLPELGDGEHYCCDLVGFAVVLESGETIGTLRNVMSTASNDIYEVAGEKGEILLPVIPEVVIRVDQEEKQIVVRLPEVADAI